MPFTPKDIIDAPHEQRAKALEEKIDVALQVHAKELDYPGSINIPIDKDDLPVLQDVFATYRKLGWEMLMKNRVNDEGPRVYWIWVRVAHRKASTSSKPSTKQAKP